MAGAAGTDEGGAGGATETALDDEQIVKVVTTLDDGEIAAAEVAAPAVQVAAVNSFAELMIADHTAANAQVLALVATEHIAPRASALSEQLDTEGAALLVTLSAATSANIDATYMDAQIQMHQEALQVFDNDLIPFASDVDLRTLLTSARATVASHLTQAQTIRASL